MENSTKEILDHFGVSVSNIKNTGRIFMMTSRIRRKMGVAYLAFDILLDKVTEIIPFERGKWTDFWGIIKFPVKIKEISDVTGRCEAAIKKDLKKLEKMGYIKALRASRGKIYFVRVFPEYANLIYKELPELGKLFRKFEQCVKAGLKKEGQEIYDEIREYLKGTIEPKQEKKESESKPDSVKEHPEEYTVEEQIKFKEGMLELCKKLSSEGCNNKERVDKLIKEIAELKGYNK